MRYSFIFLLTFLSFSSFANRNCNVTKAINDHLWDEERTRKAEFQILSDTSRVHPPKRCTPFMQDAKFIPLTKRVAAGSNRERFMDSDCNVYEWDSQHGNFEKYTSSGNKLSHAGDVSPIHGIPNTGKARGTRDYEDNNTGYAGMDLKKLCKAIKKGDSLRPVEAKGLKCK